MGAVSEPTTTNERVGAQVARAVAIYVGVRALGLLSIWVAANLSDRSWIAVLTKWDGQWYAGIAANGYGGIKALPDGRVLSDYAFFPLLPVLEAGVHAVTGLEPALAGLLVSLISAPLAAMGIFRCVEQASDRNTAFIAVVLWGCLPVAGIQTMAYTESLFTALAAWGLFCCLNQKWMVAGALAVAAGLTRPTGVAVCAAVLVAVLVAYRHSGRLTARQVVASVLSTVGCFAYLAWVAWQVGSVTGYFDVTAGWGNGFDGGRAFAVWIWHQPLAVSVILVVGSGMLVAAMYACIRMRVSAPLLAYGAVMLTLAFVTSGYFGSRPRYLVPAFVLLMPVAAWLARRRPLVCASVLVALGISSIAYGTQWLLGPGPP